ncbi:MAG: hypothetical protein CSA68_11605 [Rhodobacterales bacterium]|nr:MAG: hypothetical protein CSA68_11605 [Rhodobacterales bacterium]
MTIDELASQIDALRADLIRSNPPLIMTSQEAATFLGVSDETMLRWRKDGFGPSYSQPNCRVVRYLRDDVVAWLEENRG